METDLQKQIQDRLQELPEDVQKAVTAADLDSRIQAVGKKHNLHIDQIGKLGDETVLVMLAFSDPAEFASNISVQLNIPQNQADTIAANINNEIFMPIRQSMQEFLEERSIMQTIEEAPSAQPSETSSAVVPTQKTQPTSTAVPMTTKPAITLPSAPAPAATTPKPAAPPPLRSAAVGAPHPSANPPKPQVPTAPHPHDLTLVEKTVTTPAKTPNAAPPPTLPAQGAGEKAPQKPDSYKTDPYREPIEP